MPNSTCAFAQSLPTLKPSLSSFTSKSLTKPTAHRCTSNSKAWFQAMPSMSIKPDVILIGSGFGALSAAAALTSYGLKPLILESHYAPGGVAHGFDVKTSAGNFHFDTGPSFFCGLTQSKSLNPLKHALDAVNASVPCVSYPSFAIHDLLEGTVTVSENEEITLESVRSIAGPNAANQLKRFYDYMAGMHSAMDVPSVALRGDWRIGPVLLRRWPTSLARLLPYVGEVSAPVGAIMQRIGITDPFVQRILDVEAFLLSGLKTPATIAAEIAFMVGERRKPGAMEYPIGGARAIVDEFVRGIERKGGEVRCRSHVKEIIVNNGRAGGVVLKNGEQIRAEHVFSNASLWDTVKLLPDNVAKEWQRGAMATPTVESFMHAHVAIPSEGLEGLTGHHAVVIDSTKDIAVPGNTVMISIPTIWSPEMAPEGFHIVHAYTLEKYDKWPALSKKRKEYEEAKKEAAEPLFTAIRHVIPDLDERLSHENAILKLGSPATHARFNRRYKGTYGAAIDASKAEFEWPGDIPVQGLKRCSDSTFPGIGVPSSAAAGLIAANELVSIGEHNVLVDKVFPR